ncbi:MAG: hypothetical protein JW768_06305 [Chitinispirillaceae bacterium]|nr:hypothetical protein [Chitinispirillaceae bacterium]
MRKNEPHHGDCLPASLRGATVSVYSLTDNRVPSLSVRNAPASFTLTTRALAPGVYQLAIEHEGVKAAKVFVAGR